VASIAATIVLAQRGSRCLERLVVGHLRVLAPHHRQL
jgi:hypothetical protein